MKWYWENEGKPLESGEHAGQLAATIDFEDNSPVHRYYAADEKGMVDQLLQAQANAAQKIRELKKEQLQASPDRVPSAPQPVAPLSADERASLPRDLADPVKAPTAIRRIVEAETGVPLDRIRERVTKEDDELLAKQYEQEAIAFVEATPDYHVCAHNSELLTEYLTTKNKPLTRKNFADAWDRLKAAKLVVTASAAAAAPQPSTPDTTPTETQDQTGAVRTRPRGEMASSGIRNGDSGATPTHTPRSASKYTIADIEAMPSDDYKARLLGEPGFAEAVAKAFSK